MFKLNAMTRGILLAGMAWVASLGLAPLAWAGEAFRSGDVIARTQTNLVVYRGSQQVATLGETGPVCADAARNLWTAVNQGGKLVLRKYSSTTDKVDYPATLDDQIASVRKILPSGASLFVLYTAKRSQLGEPIKVVRFSTADNTFAKPIALMDASGQPALLIDKDSLWDAAMLPNGQLWLSGFPNNSGGMSGYAVGNLPAGLEKEFASESMGRNIRTFQVNPGNPKYGGNNRGLAVWSDTQLLVLCGHAGRLTVVDPLNLDDAAKTYPLTQAPDPALAGNWAGFMSVLNTKQQILVASTISRKIYAIDPTSKQVSGVFALDILVLELAAIP